jgi:hypothetical protein
MPAVLQSAVATTQGGLLLRDLFVVPTIGFKLLYCMVILAHGRRQLVHHAVTAHPTAGRTGRHSISLCL